MKPMPMRLKTPRILAATAVVAMLSAAPQALAQPVPVTTSGAGAFLSGHAAATMLDLESAAWFYSFVLQRDPANPQLAATVFSLWLEVGNIAAAAPLATALINIDPGFENGRFVLATQAIRSGNYDIALDHLDAIEGDAVATLVVGLLRAWIHQAAGETDEALALLDSLDNEPWYAAFTEFHSALIADLAGRADVAMFFAEQAFQNDASIGPTQLYASLLARSGNIAGADLVLTRFLERAPDQPEVQRQLDELRAGDAGGPLAPDIRAGAALVFFDIATAIMGDDGGTTSVPFLQLSRRLAPDSGSTLQALGELLESLNRFEQAISTFEAVPPASAFALNAALRAATDETILGRADDAIFRLESLRGEYSTDPMFAATLANIYNQLGRYEDMEAVLTPAIDAIDDPVQFDWRLYFIRGIAYERTGRWPQAEADFREALDLSPEQADVLNYLGYSFVDRGERLDEGLAMIERALAQRPESGSIVDSLGWAYYKLGRYEEAVTTLEQAIELEPGHYEINDHLGDAYWRAGRRVEAVFQWTHALVYDPPADVAARIEEKIRDGLPDAGAD